MADAAAELKLLSMPPVTSPPLDINGLTMAWASADRSPRTPHERDAQERPGVSVVVVATTCCVFLRNENVVPVI